MAGFNDLARPTYEFDVITPGGENMVLTMRALTQAEALALDQAYPPPDPDTVISDFTRDAKGNIVPVRDEAKLREARTEWLQRRMYATIVRTWVTDDLPGESEEEKIDAVRNLPAWAVNALWKCAQIVTMTAEDAIKHRPFQ